MDNAPDSSGWDAEAASFDAEPDHGLHSPRVREAWRTLLTSLLPPAPARVADLGCGTGSLSLLLAEDGYAVDGLDFAPEMVRRAQAKAGTFPDTSFRVGDAADPDLPRGSFDVALCRHVLWALPDPGTVLERWVELLAPDGRLVLVEGSWSTGAGLTAAQTITLVESAGLEARLRPLPDAELWGKRISDERYAVVGRRTRLA
ncbi:class I SAM-dependent methyltransferase [Nocardioides mangrovi]|uniref:Class I SAM-dependent methyltransferase n=1 Tax=Nocardioides mangrovi TaxID=2874580 RepID=A0ABS7UHU0_9ACTN|nr:class I SAM-dependent methyltransferase [Nocardioides mangrovi]MBZ5740566.1 class I SAM-dependent methyltransferase [Nocardioides mangrovi]